MAKNDSELLCRECGRKSQTSFASSLRSGWEMCCGYTMSLVSTKSDIEKAVEGTIVDQLPPILVRRRAASIEREEGDK